ncbi:MAG: MogA/MoaB family molybdenum cofactor biosynthesis protein [Dehalococcoidia bacterium]|nr:MogA/MoaB family molybdenum cofactor biosynthesis protein [Chloroflexi bacterium CFX7]MCK6565939.1 MogA/MoaB family molybdenum cofactor biosynthesis protein [Dehalococcoidia bacterium]MCL4231149.1 MogA/MoaB family molybdenum cofactor biosynthesis protein [Dehalococcoidia bacterium]NUQ54963.1 MogA/MoaB family molybdenum cofactor biosynthesis protein [Dehalococcoidia bacterium]RIL02679.1 MAG: molybdenum cofactor biosynthesis protein [bacterium]
MARVGILTASDSGARGERVDASGDLVAARCVEGGHTVVRREVLSDDRALLVEALARWCDEGIADVVITTGGTGLTARDVTPEATREIGEREVPGIPLAVALEGLKKTPYAALSRGVAVTRGATLVVNLPGSPKAVSEGMDVLLPLLEHVAELLGGPVNHDGRQL